jgi:opacity protein-like surface antigen
MKSSTILAVVCGVMVSAGAANANGLYLKGDVGYSWSHGVNLKNDGAFDPLQSMLYGKLNDAGQSTVGSIGVGYELSSFRVDLTYNVRNNYSIKGSDTFPGGTPVAYAADLESTSWMVSLLKDFKMKQFSPYIGVGVGVADNKVSGFTFTDTVGGVTYGAQGGKASGNFAWQLIGGVAYQLTPKLAADLSYTYVDLCRVKTNSGDFTLNGVPQGAALDGTKGSLTASELRVGLRYSF